MIIIYHSKYDMNSLRIETTSNPTWLEKIQKTVKSILQAVNLIQTTPVDKSGKLM